MKNLREKLSFLLLCFMIQQTTIAQDGIEKYWKTEVLENHKAFNNYSFKVNTVSTVRGIYDGEGYKDTTYFKNDSVWLYIEQIDKEVIFLGMEGNDFISYTQVDTNTSIDLRKSWITINSMKSFYGKYMDNYYIGNNIRFYADILGRGKYWKKIDKLYDTILSNKHYRVFEWVDSNTTENDIKMIEDVKAIINVNTNLIERIVTDRRNNTLAELGLGAIHREIEFTYLNFNYNMNEEKEKFSIDFPLHNYLVVKENFPWAVSKDGEKNKAESEKRIEEWNQSKIILSSKVLNTPLKDFEGSTLRLKNCKGWILLDTWFSTCYPCFELMKLINANHGEFDKRGIKIISLNITQNPTEYLKAFCQKQGVKMEDLYFCKEIKDDLSQISNVYPALYLINLEKKIVYKKYEVYEIQSFLEELDRIMNNKEK